MRQLNGIVAGSMILYLVIYLGIYAPDSSPIANAGIALLTISIAVVELSSKLRPNSVWKSHNRRRGFLKG